MSIDLGNVARNDTVLLINPFEVPAEREDEFLAFWRRAAAFLEQRPGYVATHLQKAQSPDARFRYVNIAVWESQEAFQNAVGDPEFQALVGPYMEVFPHFPGIYRPLE